MYDNGRDCYIDKYRNICYDSNNIAHLQEIIMRQAHSPLFELNTSMTPEIFFWELVEGYMTPELRKHVSMLHLGYENKLMRSPEGLQIRITVHRLGDDVFQMYLDGKTGNVLDVSRRKKILFCENLSQITSFLKESIDTLTVPMNTPL